MRFKKLYNKLEKEGFDYILSDRYFYDGLLNIFYLSQKKGAKLLEKELSSLKIPKPDVAVYLKAEPEIIMRRERTPDQGIKYLKAKEILYAEASRYWELLTIDGDRPPEEIFSEIKKALQI